MKTTGHTPRTRPVIAQTRNNTTLWIGHLLSESHDHFGGQTFYCPTAGWLDNIQVFSSAVTHPGDVFLTLHSFDPASKTWGPVIAQSSVSLHQGDADRWIRFAFADVHLEQGAHYGFRLQAPNALIALGEAVSGTKQPFTFGHEWHGDSQNEKGYYYSYFSLAFRVEMCA